jgi:outer membrane protein assembly factor BamE
MPGHHDTLSEIAMQRILCLGLCLMLAACAEFPGVYKIDIEQGNIITQEMVDQLKPGMSRSQVRYIMGTPLITDTFNPDRWDYLYSIQRKGKQREQEHLILGFDGDKLVSISGDYAPGMNAAPATDVPEAKEQQGS